MLRSSHQLSILTSTQSIAFFATLLLIASNATLFAQWENGFPGNVVDASGYVASQQSVMFASDISSLSEIGGPTDPTSAANNPKSQDKEGASEIELLKKRIESLEKELKSGSKPDVKDKETKDKELKGTDSKPKDPQEKKQDEWTDVSSEKWNVKLGGHVQMDYVNWAQAAPSIPNTQDYFEFRRLRLVADGTGYGVYDFRLQMTLEPESAGESAPGAVTSPEVKDAYFSLNEIPMLGRFRIGNFFVPFSLEQVTNDTMNIFMERSIPTQGVFSPDREVGFAFYNCNDFTRE